MPSFALREVSGLHIGGRLTHCGTRVVSAYSKPKRLLARFENYAGRNMVVKYNLKIIKSLQSNKGASPYVAKGMDMLKLASCKQKKVILILLCHLKLFRICF